MMWFVILAFAIACTAMVSVGAMAVLLVSITNALQARRVPELAADDR